MSEKEFYHWGIRFFTPNHVFPVDSEYNGPKTEKDAIEYLELFLLQAKKRIIPAPPMADSHFVIVLILLKF